MHPLFAAALTLPLAALFTLCALCLWIATTDALRDFLHDITPNRSHAIRLSALVAVNFVGVVGTAWGIITLWGAP